MAFKEFKRLFVILSLALIATSLLMLLFNTGIATTFMGVGNYDARKLYYSTYSSSRQSRIEADSVVIYAPYYETPQDKREVIAKELEYISGFHPKAIVFDYVFKHYSYTDTSDSFLVASLQHCLDSGIFIAAPYAPDLPVKENFFHESLDIPKGMIEIPAGLVGDLDSQKVRWMPNLVTGLTKNSVFYKGRSINFESPDKISAVNSSDYDPEVLAQSLKGKYVIFSDYTDRGDYHSLPFEVKTLHIKDNKPVYGNTISGAEALWYAMRSQVYDYWDVSVHPVISILIALLLAIVYLLILDSIHKDIKHLILRNVVSFVVFIALEVIFIPCIGLALMRCGHRVLALSYPSVILVFVNLFRYETRS